MICAAFGCNTVVKGRRLGFCAKDARRARALGADPDAVKDAVVALAVHDGYLTRQLFSAREIVHR